MIQENATASTGTRRRRRVYVVLPAYNEEACIGRLLHRIDESMFEANLPYHVVVVNDGSRDGTASVVESCKERMPITLQTHEVNMGLGATIRDGLRCASELAEDEDIIVSMDADDTHTPGLILRMVRMIHEGHDVVIASRYQKGSRTIGVPWFRRLTSFGGSMLFQILLPIQGVRDFTCGFRAYRAAVIKRAFAEYGDHFVDQEGFQCMVDILLKLRKFDLLFGEVPFILRYDLKEGASKMNVQSTILKTLRLIAKRRFEG